MYGGSSNDAFGSAFAVIGDATGDGYADIAVGAYLSDQGGTNAGRVYVLEMNGVAGVGDATVEKWSRIDGDEAAGYVGGALGAGDFNGDGDVDLAFGASGENSSKGRVYVAFQADLDAGTDASDLPFFASGVSNSDQLGVSTVLGDLTGDGYDELVACSPYDDDNGASSGTCWVVAGSATRETGSVHGTTVSSLDTAVITGSAAGDELGYGTQNALAIGDFDDDGAEDLAVGMYGYDSNSGAILIYGNGTLSGTETLSTATWVIEGSINLGRAFSLSDLDGDSVPDLLSGQYSTSGGLGVAWLLSGGISAGTYALSSAGSASWTAENTVDYLGRIVSNARDIDGDGVPEFAVAATGYDVGSYQDAGRVYVVSGD